MSKIKLTISPQSDADGICESQTLNSSGTQNLNINGALSSSGIVSFDSPHLVVITSAGNDSSRSFTITGTDARDVSITESVTGGNIDSVVTTDYFKTITSISIDGNSAAAVTVGVDGRASSNWGLVDTTGVNIGFGCEMSTGATFTYSMQHTFGDTSKLDETDFYWFTHESLSGKTDSQDGNYAFGFSASRAIITSYTSGSLTVNMIGASR
jgi:hypothetical protein